MPLSGNSHAQYSSGPRQYNFHLHFVDPILSEVLTLSSPLFFHRLDSKNKITVEAVIREVSKGTQGGSEAGLAQGTSPVSGRMSLSVVCLSVEGQQEGVGGETPCLPSRGEPIWVLRQRLVCLGLGRRNALWWLEVSPPAGMLSPAAPHWTSGLKTPFLPCV